MSDDSHRHHFHGRRVSRPLRTRHAGLMEELLPRLAITPETAGLGRPECLFPTPPREVWLEIGFGGGEHLAWQAANTPDIGIIGAEPFINGVAKLLSEIDARRLSNVRICNDDVRYLLEKIGTASLSRAFLLFPDPWPKRRHNKRRFISPETLAMLHRVLKPGAEFRVASDIPDYIRWTLEHIHAHGGFSFEARTASDWRNRPADWPPTRYEAKALREGRVPSYLSFRTR